MGHAGGWAARVLSRVSGAERHVARMRHTWVRSPAVAALTRASGSASSSFLPSRTTGLACRKNRGLDERIRAREESCDKISLAFARQSLQNADRTPYQPHPTLRRDVLFGRLAKHSGIMYPQSTPRSSPTARPSGVSRFHLQKRRFMHRSINPIKRLRVPSASRDRR